MDLITTIGEVKVEFRNMGSDHLDYDACMEVLRFDGTDRVELAYDGEIDGHLYLTNENARRLAQLLIAATADDDPHGTAHMTPVQFYRHCLAEECDGRAMTNDMIGLAAKIRALPDNDPRLSAAATAP